MSKRARVVGNFVRTIHNRQQLPLHGDILTMVVHAVALVCDTGTSLLNLRGVRRNTRDEVQRWMTSNKEVYSLRACILMKSSRTTPTWSTPNINIRFSSILLRFMLIQKWSPLVCTTLVSIWGTSNMNRSTILRMLAAAVCHISTSSAVDARKLLNEAAKYLNLSIKCDCAGVIDELNRRRKRRLGFPSPQYCKNHIQPLLAALNNCPNCNAPIVSICNCDCQKCLDCAIFK